MPLAARNRCVHTTATGLLLLVAAMLVACGDSDDDYDGPRLTGNDDPAEAFARTPDGATPAPGSWRVVPAFPNVRFSRPLWVGCPPGRPDRMVVLEQRGVIRTFANDRGVGSSEKALDIAWKTRRQHNEEGLLGIAFHPRFADNRFAYVHYSASNPRRGVLSRFTFSADGRSVDPDSEVVLLEQRQPWGNHNGGGLAFGPDGYLYVSFGDGGAGGDPEDNGQNLGTWKGAMLRIDVDNEADGRVWAVPPDNPFVDREGARPEIWAWGLRNVWRFSFDPETGECWAGDVGQNALEEIDILEAGGNYGWRAYEGTRPFGKPRGGGSYTGPFIPPVVEYGRSEGISVTGGYVYRGSRLPALIGWYIYADYGSGNIWALRRENGRVQVNVKIARHPDVSSFGLDADGELLICSFDGRIHRLEPR